MKHQTRIVGQDWYVYDSKVLNLANGASDIDTINIQAQSDFRLYYLSYMAFIGGGAVTESTRVIPLISVQLTDTGSGQQLLADQLPIPLIFGTGERIYTLPEPRIFRANTTLSVNFINFSTATTYNIHLGFHGVKVYR